ncbi:hypothetical protein [Streptomyces sp. NPDC048710]|uniref:hypothetical protein n=1 Tax=unclassified Streptomyces TaxID=2593676 RepID=UPI00371FB0B4
MLTTRQAQVDVSVRRPWSCRLPHTVKYTKADDGTWLLAHRAAHRARQDAGLDRHTNSLLKGDHARIGPRCAVRPDALPSPGRCGAPDESGCGPEPSPIGPLKIKKWLDTPSLGGERPRRRTHHRRQTKEPKTRTPTGHLTPAAAQPGKPPDNSTTSLEEKP